MVFTEFRFFIFFAIVFVIYWSLKSSTAKKKWLLVNSYLFYGCWDWRFLSLIFISTGFDYFIAQKIAVQDNPSRRKLFIIASLTVNLGILFAFKYANFFIGSAVELSHYFGFQPNVYTLQVILPVGISFYTFQTLSYTIDVYRKKLPVCNSKLDFALFVAFFPQLVAGPIVRAADFLPQLKHDTILAAIRFRPALWLFTAGFIKKACVADNIATYVDAFYRHPASFDSGSAWIATVLYAMQIYCDFSGYSDIAIACAAMLGYQLCLNFKHPYFAVNITEFWHRWHMSLSTWLRDYLYIPLGGNRGTPLQTQRNVMITMLLGGLWHGASWNFVTWGGIHGIALILHKYWQKHFKINLGLSILTTLFSTLITFGLVNFCWVFFRSKGFSDSMIVFGKLVGFATPYTNRLPVSLVLVIAAFFACHFIEFKFNLIAKMATWAPLKTAVLLAFIWAFIMQFLPLAANPFIYFQF